MASYVDAATVETATGLQILVKNFDGGVIGSVTTIGEIQAETIIIDTFDYNWSAWSVTATSGGYPTVGDIGNENDNGIIPS